MIKYEIVDKKIKFIFLSLKYPIYNVEDDRQRI